jgi:hypothetical protein
MQYLTNLLGIEKWQRTATSFTHSFGSSFLSSLLGQSLVSVRLGGYSSFHSRDFMISLFKSLHSLKSKYSRDLHSIFDLHWSILEFGYLTFYFLFVDFSFHFVLSANNIGSWHGQEMWVEQSSKVIPSFLRRCKEGLRTLREWRLIEHVFGNINCSTYCGYKWYSSSWYLGGETDTWEVCLKLSVQWIEGVRRQW